MKDGNKLISIIVKVLKNAASVAEEIFINHEYKGNIGTLYKGSRKESNELLRFKERFKRQYQFAYGYAIESMGR